MRRPYGVYAVLNRLKGRMMIRSHETTTTDQ
jgi:hypothetical protein